MNSIDAKRSLSAKRAAVTRQRRKEKRVYDVANQIIKQPKIGPRQRCVICHKALSDTESIERGIGSECWQHVLAQIYRLKAA